MQKGTSALLSFLVKVHRSREGCYGISAGIGLRGGGCKGTRLHSGQLVGRTLFRAQTLQDRRRTQHRKFLEKGFLYLAWFVFASEEE